MIGDFSNHHVFRYDIVVLRAIAVIAVIVFHYNKDFLPGGYAGVDVFFVVSGYLMTRIIFSGLSSQNFSLFKFIKSRFNRIYPALIVLVAVVLFLGYLFVMPKDLIMLSKHSISSLASISNYVYQGEIDYFNVDNKKKFLLHTWSLSIEWQFYLIYPMVLIFLSKAIRIDKIKWVILFLFFVLLGASVLIYSYDKNIAYFSLSSRGWELVLGGLIYLFPVSGKFTVKKNIFLYLIQLLGLFLIVLSFFIYDDKTPWPSYYALLPTLGACLYLIYGGQTVLFGNFLFYRIGDWSYSIYLVHWPLLVYLGLFGYKLSVSSYILLVLFLSYFLYTFVESKRKHLVRYFILLFVVALSSLYFLVGDGFPGRLSNQFRLSSDELFEKYYGAMPFYHEANGNLFNNNLTQGDKYTSSDLIIAGDSYAMQYFRYFNDRGYSFTTVTKTMCMINKDYTVDKSSACSKMYDLLADAFNKNPQADVLIAFNWTAYYSRMSGKVDGEELDSSLYQEAVVNQLNDMLNNLPDNKNLFIMGSQSYPGYDVWGCLAGKELLGGFLFRRCPEFSDNSPNLDWLLESFANNHNNVYFLSPKEALCDDRGCVNYINNIPIHFDGDHLSTQGVQIVGDYFINKFGSLLKDDLGFK